MKKYFLAAVLFVVPCVFLTQIATAASIESTSSIPIALDAYHDGAIAGLWKKLQHRVDVDPFNLVATFIFFAAIVHTFMAGFFRKLAHKFDEQHKKACSLDPRKARCETVSFKAEIMHFMGEVEAVFGIWVLPLIAAIVYYYDWGTAQHYLEYKVNYIEPMFVVVIMAIASTRPVLYFAEHAMQRLAALGKGTPLAWWLSILTIGPVLGSFITEPAAMTICALLLGRRFYKLNPSRTLCYATLGLLFVNISVGGTLTHFAAPPVIMVAGKWSWDLKFMFMNFGLQSFVGIVIANSFYFFCFRNEFKKLARKAQGGPIFSDASIQEAVAKQTEMPIPFWVISMHVLFLAWTVVNLHYPPLFIGGFLFFIAFTQATAHYQYKVSLKTPLLVGFFLAGLVTHGTLQQWWIAPVLNSLGEFPLFVSAALLTAFNDNAAITFLASLVPEFQTNIALQKAVVEGAVVGGGLTVIANAPNPAGQSLLNKYFKGGISPLGLLLGALIPTLILAISYRLFPGVY